MLSSNKPPLTATLETYHKCVHHIYGLFTSTRLREWVQYIDNSRNKHQTCQIH